MTPDAESPEEKKYQELTRANMPTPIARQIARLPDDEAREKMREAHIPEAEIERIIKVGGAPAEREEKHKGIPTTTGAPKLTAGGDPVSDTERLHLRPYKANWDGALLLAAERQLRDSGVDRRVDMNGACRWLEVGLPLLYRKQLHDQRRYRFEWTTEDDVGVPFEGTYHLPPGFAGGRNYLKPAEENLPHIYTLTVPSQLQVPDQPRQVMVPQHFWVMDLVKPERSSRDFTGFHCIPKHWLSFGLHWLLEQRGLWQPLVNATSIADLSLQQRFDIRRAFTDAEEANSTHFFNYRNVVTVFDEFLEGAAAAGSSPEEFQDKFYTWFRAQSRYRYWSHVEKTARMRDKAHRVQSIPEAIAAQEALTDLVSAVIRPLATSLTVEEEREDKVIYGILLHWGTELVRYATADEINDLRKTIDGIKQYLMLHRTNAQQLLQLSHSKSAGDGWYPSSWDDVTKGDFVISIPELSGTANGILQQVLYGPIADYSDYFKVAPGPEVGEWHTRLLCRTIDSFNTLIEMADSVRPSEGNLLTEKDLKERWNPKLINTLNDELVRGWWDEGEKRVYAEYDLGYPDREFRAAPYQDLLYWQDSAWAFGPGDDQFVFPQIPEFTNGRFREAGLPESVRLRVDGPDPNYFRHWIISREIWRTQPLVNIWKRVMDEVVKPKIAAGDILGLRPDLGKFFTQLPTRHAGSWWVTKLFEWLLRLADNLTLAWVVWLSVEGRTRIAELGDMKRALADGWGIYPTEDLALMFPDERWGDLDEPDAQYNRYTFVGQQKARAAFLMIAYENLNVSCMKGVIESLHCGFADGDELLRSIKSGLESRRLYWPRFLDLVDYVRIFIKTIPGKAFDVLGRLNGKVNTPASVDVDNYGLKVIRMLIGETEDDDGWVQAVLDRRWINKIRAQLPGA